MIWYMLLMSKKQEKQQNFLRNSPNKLKIAMNEFQMVPGDSWKGIFDFFRNVAIL